MLSQYRDGKAHGPFMKINYFGEVQTGTHTDGLLDCQLEKRYYNGHVEVEVWKDGKYVM